MDTARGGAVIALDLEVSRGEFVLRATFELRDGVTVLFGRSGAGKSTLLDALAGLDRRARGRITHGDDVWLDSARGIVRPTRTRNVGYVFQRLALFPHLTVAENVAFGLAHLPIGTRTARVRSLLARLDVAPLADRKPETLSGGERQRVALARALAPEPALLLLDEPFAALDRPRRRDLVALVRDIVGERALVALFVTHDQEEAEAIGDRVVVLDEGRIVADGHPIDVLEGSLRWLAASRPRGANVLDGEVVVPGTDAGASELRVGAASVFARPIDAAPGERVLLAVRETDVTLALDPPGRISASNVLRGTVRKLEREGRAMRVHVEGAVPLVAELTPAGAERLALAEGTEVWAIVKARACFVARPDRVRT